MSCANGSEPVFVFQALVLGRLGCSNHILIKQVFISYLEAGRSRVKRPADSVFAEDLVLDSQIVSCRAVTWWIWTRQLSEGF